MLFLLFFKNMPFTLTDSLNFVRTAWSVAKPTRSDYIPVVAEIPAAKALGEADIFDRVRHVDYSHMILQATQRRVL